MAGRLWVFLSDRRAGFLDENEGKLTFTYESGVTTPLSVNLPIRNEPFEDSQCRTFFSNLLPEGSWRQAVCRQLRIDENNDFALLKAIGSECAGAVTLEEDPNWTPATGNYKKTTEGDLRRWVLNPAARPSVQATPGLRLSLAGAQDKLLIYLDKDTPYLCEGGAPSSVILKPDIQDIHNAVEFSAFNELLSSTLAKACKLDSAEPFWYAGAYAVKRYDRVQADEKLKRLHQEDFAQIAGVPAASKYEEHGGPGWTGCFGILDAHSAVPAKDRLELLNRLFFNFCLGNNDAHAKNFALLYRPEGGKPSLAPAYDLVCTLVYPTLSKDMAMKIGGESSPNAVKTDAWLRFAEDTGFTAAPVKRMGIAMASSVSAALPGLQKDAEVACPAIKNDIYPGRRRNEFFEKYSSVIKENCDVLKRSLQ